MAKNDVISRYLRYIGSFADRIDWGGRSTDGTPQYQQTSESLWTCIGGQRRPYSLTRKLVEEHLSDRSTFFFLSGRGTKHRAMMIDVDAHEGQTDALDVVQLLASGPFAGQYFEPSTNGGGYHLYVRVASEVGAAQFNGQAGVIANAVGRMVVDHGFESKVEVKGTCTLLDYRQFSPTEYQAALDEGTIDPRSGQCLRSRQVQTAFGDRVLVPVGIKTRGGLGKFPRLSIGGLEQAMTHLEDAPILTAADLRRIAVEAEMGDDWAAACRYQKVPRMGRADLERHLGLNVSGETTNRADRASRPAQGDAGHTGCLSEGVEGRGLSSRSDQADLGHTGCLSGHFPDSLARTRLAAFRLGHQLRRVPTEAELATFYVEAGYNSRPENPHRPRRIRSVLGFIKKVFDPAVGRAGFETRADDLERAVRAHVVPEHRSDLSYHWVIHDRDLAAMLYLVESASFDSKQSDRLRWSLPQQSLVAFADRLRADGVDGGRWGNANKFSSAKEILKRAGLIHQVDSRFSPKGKGPGVAMRYHVGPNAPSFKDFQVFCTVHLPRFESAGKSRTSVLRPFDGTRGEVLTTIPCRVDVRTAA